MNTVTRLKSRTFSRVTMLVDRIFEIFRYAVTGTLSVALNLLIITALTEWAGLHYLVSISVCFVTVTVANFYLNRSWTFGKRQPGVPLDLARFLFATLMLWPLSLVSCGFCVEILHVPYPVAIVVVAIAYVPVGYLLHRRWSFGLRSGAQPREAPASLLAGEGE
jgi:putative flippase GtrA